MQTQTSKQAQPEPMITGEFVTINNERYYAIKNVDRMDPFFISVISNSDHWLFISSNGALTAGRVSPDTALFPYECVDKIYDDALNTGSKTIIRTTYGDKIVNWEPFNLEHVGIYIIECNVYKNTLGNKVYFEEVNKSLGLTYRYSWQSSDKYGFVRSSEIINHSDAQVDIELIDGIQNVLPAGTPKFTQTVSSNLVDAYKWTEVDSANGLALYTLYSAITDRAEPCESLRATTVFSIGLDSPEVILSSKVLSQFKQGREVAIQSTTRGVRGAYLLKTSLHLAAQQTQVWYIVADLEKTQSDITELSKALEAKSELLSNIQHSISEGDDELAAILASADGFQLVNEESVGVHHYANTLFNVLRGGIFSDQYRINKQDFMASVKQFNAKVYERNSTFMSGLPDQFLLSELMTQVEGLNDPQFARLAQEYLPIYFGRRHGDPSRPWNQFVIKLKDEQNQPLLTYQGNWRDIFQNWEALAYSYPEFIEGMIAKFVNASTFDGYNPYRITKDGIDWEVEEPDDPWSYIGYWGDHQIIYLLKLLEVSKQFHPQKLSQLLLSESYCYANVPYKIKPFEDVVKDAKSTVDYDEALSEKIENRVAKMGADGKLMLNGNDEVYQVSLLEKLLVPLLAKLGNLVIDGGIWLNTQRPEWNDANNALVGQGLSMVTLNYMRRYVLFVQDLFASHDGKVNLSSEVATWLTETVDALNELTPQLDGEKVSAELRLASLTSLGQASSKFRVKVYEQEGFSGQSSCNMDSILALFEQALVAIDHTISTNKREDGLYHAYNLLDLSAHGANINYLYPMLEGQVAALTSGKMNPEEVIEVINALFKSDVYRADQNTFMLYPDRKQTAFMEKNCLSSQQIDGIDSLKRMLSDEEDSIVSIDAESNIRFHADIGNKGDLGTRIEAQIQKYPALIKDQALIFDLYEATFNHLAFTGRSGGMFGFEGLGCVYWHMVSKLLLAVGENFQVALLNDTSPSSVQQLGHLYYKVRDGIGFNKTPEEYGAFPADPYSHTPKHAGAQQPGMTGQVKEELIARFIELGLIVNKGAVSFAPALLRKQEFLTHAIDFRYLDTSGNWQILPIKPNQLAFTWCQVPVVYKVNSSSLNTVTIIYNEGEDCCIDALNIDAEQASALFKRTGSINRIVVDFDASALFDSE
ncbi:MAG: hypothetical protein ACJAVV_000381 [Alphaproteobacteria bacterium]|jgi:hypothetical protein